MILKHISTFSAYDSRCGKKKYIYIDNINKQLCLRVWLVLQCATVTATDNKL